MEELIQIPAVAFDAYQAQKLNVEEVHISSLDILCNMCYISIKSYKDQREEDKKMLKNLLNKLRWDETMTIAAFAEAGYFGMIEKAIKHEKAGQGKVRRQRRTGRRILVHEV